MEDTEGRRWMETMYAEVSPAQAEVFRLVMILLKERV